MYKVTLSIPIYNSEKYIERALLSALNQTYGNIEFLIIDDRGTDNSMEIVNDIISQHPRGKSVTIITHPINIGTGATKNTAIENAKGEYLFFMDSDDEITPDCISLLYEKMIETPVDVVAASHKRVTFDKTNEKLMCYKDEIIDFALANAYYMSSKSFFIYTWNKLYNLYFLRKYNIKCFPHHLNEDIFFTYQVILNAQSCRLLSNITYYYYETATSTVEQQKKVPLRFGKQYEEIFCAEKEYLQNYRYCPFYNELVKYTYCYSLNYAYRVYDSELISSREKNHIVSNILKYPLSFNRVIKARERFHHIMYIKSIMPTNKLKIFFFRNYPILVNRLKMKIYKLFFSNRMI